MKSLARGRRNGKGPQLKGVEFGAKTENLNGISELFMI